MEVGTKGVNSETGPHTSHTLQSHGNPTDSIRALEGEQDVSLEPVGGSVDEMISAAGRPVPACRRRPTNSRRRGVSRRRRGSGGIGLGVPVVELNGDPHFQNVRGLIRHLSSECRCVIACLLCFAWDVKRLAVETEKLILAADGGLEIRRWVSCWCKGGKSLPLG